MDEQKKARVKLIVSLVIIFIVGFVGWNLYQNSLQNDFNDIDKTQIERVADTYTGFYHRPGCPKAKTIVTPEVFKKGKTAEDNNKAAEDKGYHPCKRCHPQED